MDREGETKTNKEGEKERENVTRGNGQTRDGGWMYVWVYAWIYVRTCFVRVAGDVIANGAVG